MGQILIRKLDDAVLDGLKARARANNRSTEAEARAIIGSAVLPPDVPRRSLMSFVGLHPTGRTIEQIVADVREIRDGGPD